MNLTVSGLFLFILTVYGQTTSRAGVKVHIYVDAPMNCTFAQNHCRAYKSLSVVTNEEDLEMIEEAAGGTYSNSWILSQENSCKSLKHEDTNTSAFEYLFQNSSLCAIANGGVWTNTSCLNEFSFFCYENFILVQENKTWEEALEYCRSHYTDLAFFNLQWPVNQIKKETNNTQTDSVWTGLRFLSGTWNWLNMKTIHTTLFLPSCPLEPKRCGARNVKTEQWENRDCEEKLNFLCLDR